MDGQLASGRLLLSNPGYFRVARTRPIGEEICARALDRNDWEFAFFALVDGCISAKLIRGFVQQTRAGSSQWRNHRSRMTWRENHWLAKRIRAMELTSCVGR